MSRMIAGLLAAAGVVCLHPCAPALAGAAARPTPAGEVRALDPVRAYRPVFSGSHVQDKNFYVLTLLQHEPGVRSAIARHPAARELIAERGARLGAALHADDAPAAARALRFSDEEIARVGEVLAELAREPAFRALIRGHLRAGGRYRLFEGLDDAELLARAWRSAAEGLNFVIDAYALGGRMRYPRIDAPSYDVGSLAYRRMALDAARAAHDAGGSENAGLFFEPSLRFALDLLAINRRDEAGRFEPLDEGENRAAVRRAAEADFADHPYAALLVLGAGPSEPGVALSPGGRESCAAAAALYHEGKAPFIVVSGGHVHPKQTIFCEAVEMKRQLMLAHGVPEEAILIDPHARHTTTNFRNFTRLLIAAGIPTDKPSLGVTRATHVNSIMDPRFVQRCERELGYMPAVLGQRLAPTVFEFLPDARSLHTDPLDPLDP